MNKKIITLLISTAIVTYATAYYDRYGVWHSEAIENAVEATRQATTNVLDTITGGRYSDTPKEHEERIKAERKMEDKQRNARRKYQDEQEKIQRRKEEKKEDR